MQKRVSAATSGAEMSELSERGFRAPARVLAKLRPILVISDPLWLILLACVSDCGVWPLALAPVSPGPLYNKPVTNPGPEILG